MDCAHVSFNHRFVEKMVKMLLSLRDSIRTVCRDCDPKTLRNSGRYLMGSFTQLTYHIVYATKNRHPSIKTDIQEHLYEYIGGIIRAKKGSLIEIDGVADHVHILTRLSASIAVAEVIRDIKANSSRWMNEHSKIKRSFEWQKGYGAFTVSYSRVQMVRAYLRNQGEHHKTVTFREEYVDFLKRHNIDFRPEYVFEDEHHG